MAHSCRPSQTQVMVDLYEGVCDGTIECGSAAASLKVLLPRPFAQGLVLRIFAERPRIPLWRCSELLILGALAVVAVAGRHVAHRRYGVDAVIMRTRTRPKTPASWCWFHETQKTTFRLEVSLLGGVQTSPPNIPGPNMR